MNETVIRYLPLFLEDLLEATSYIRDTLQNEKAAYGLADDVENAILNRSKNPTSFEKYQSLKDREYPYYRIYVKNYTVFYVVIPDEPRVMEVRRLLYNKRNTRKFI